MTGELFARAVGGIPSSGACADASADDAMPGGAFARGVRQRARRGGADSDRCSSRRGRRCSWAICRPRSSLEYLSGMLIGDEMRAGLATGERPRRSSASRRCARATPPRSAVRRGGGARCLDDTAPAGLWRIVARHASPEQQRRAGSSRSTSIRREFVRLVAQRDVTARILIETTGFDCSLVARTSFLTAAQRPMSTSRRTFLKTSALAAAGTVLPARSWATGARRQRRHPRRRDRPERPRHEPRRQPVARSRACASSRSAIADTAVLDTA